MQAASFWAAAGLLVSIAGIYFTVRPQIRKDKEQRMRQAEADRQAAIEVATKPYRDKVTELQADQHQIVEDAVAEWRNRVSDRERELDAMTKERDYYRTRSNDAYPGVNLTRTKDNP